MSRLPLDDWAEAERAKCAARRNRVLKFPHIAVKLTQPPLQYKDPEFWTGYIPPAVIDTLSGPKENNSPARRALIAICNEVVEEERRLANGGNPLVAPAMPGSISSSQLTRLHILFGELGITERHEKHGICIATINRHIDTTKDLSSHEATRVMESLKELMEPET